MKSSLKKVNNEFLILEKESGKGFAVKKSENEKIIIYNEELLEKVIDKNFNKKYRQLLYLIIDVNESEDSTESDVELCFIKIEDLKNLLLNKYYKYINKELLNKYLKMILLLEEKINLKKHRSR